MFCGWPGSTPAHLPASPGLRVPDAGPLGDRSRRGSPCAESARSALPSWARPGEGGHLRHAAHWGTGDWTSKRGIFRPPRTGAVRGLPASWRIDYGIKQNILRMMSPRVRRDRRAAGATAEEILAYSPTASSCRTDRGSEGVAVRRPDGARLSGRCRCRICLGTRSWGSPWGKTFKLKFVITAATSR